MNRHEIINFYEKEFLVWQDAVVGNRIGHPNTDSLIEPEDICDVTDGGRRHVFCLLVYIEILLKCHRLLLVNPHHNFHCHA